MDKQIIDKIISQRADEFAQREYMCDSYERDAMSKGYYWGYKEAEKDLGWHPVKESLPPMDEEVIVLTDVTNGQYIKDSHMICFGHIVDKNIAIDYDGWNIPGVTHWMYLPKNNGGR